MEWMNKKAMMKLALMLFLLGYTANVVNARSDSTSFLTQVLFKGDDVKPACCNKCLCKKKTPTCICLDYRETCHPACEECLCAVSHPPMCRCYDETNFCYEPCKKPELKEVIKK
ncbi:Bowman-Birk type proteinase inhibitor-like [Vicia villosa]|uniref:Bowman-Birk type proteinase inhibitor-like n=1 Tax=Vicia villosa TaxID=3911 RepID=UPI00273C4481|nr:Bowman-Birk type proteinase inhibitor-like [Vicia villosa]